jgi:hypothetical protein
MELMLAQLRLAPGLESCLMHDEPGAAVGFSYKMSLDGRSGMLGMAVLHVSVYRLSADRDSDCHTAPFLQVAFIRTPSAFSSAARSNLSSPREFRSTLMTSRPFTGRPG